MQPKSTIRQSTIDRFNIRIDRSAGPDGCHLWEGSITRKGYGTLGDKIAHRFAWELVNGPIPAGLFVCHSCDARYPVGDVTYRRCVNVSHLWLGTHKENMADMVAKGRVASGARQHGGRIHWDRVRAGEVRGGRKLTDEYVRLIRAVHAATGAEYVALARVFQVSATAIDNIVNRKSFQYLE